MTQSLRISIVTVIFASISGPIAPDEKDGKVVWASAHDLRRAFGSRWSRKVSSMVLKDLMRHSSVTTTEKFYVGIQADETGAMLAGLSGDTSARSEAEKVTLEVTHGKT